MSSGATGCPHPVDNLGGAISVDFEAVIESVQSSVQSAMPSVTNQAATWHQALERTRARSPASFEQWFSSVQVDSLDDGVLSLTARDEFVRDWVK